MSVPSLGRDMTFDANPKGRLVRLHLPLQTPRLTLRLPSPADVPELKRMFRNPLTARAAGAPLHSATEMEDPARMVRRTRREFREDAHLSLSVVLTSTGSCIGRVGLRGLDWRWKKVESLAYWLDPRYWNQGLTTEACWFVCQLAFDRLGMRRISSQALDRNLASRAVLFRLGFKEEGRERQSVCLRGRCMDMVLFGLLAEEIRSRPEGPAAAGSVRVRGFRGGSTRGSSSSVELRTEGRAGAAQGAGRSG